MHSLTKYMHILHMYTCIHIHITRYTYEYYRNRQEKNCGTTGISVSVTIWKKTEVFTLSLFYYQRYDYTTPMRLD